jgi:predicted nucleotidyltransferase
MTRSRWSAGFSGTRIVLRVIDDKLTTIREVCREYGVARLEVFGSVVDGDFDPERSDIDFLVEFAPTQDLGPWLVHYFNLKGKLEGVLGRSVDLVMASAPKSPYFLREVNRTRRTIYEAKNAEAS